MKLPVSTLLVYALVFCTELGQSMLFPLLPGFADEFALSDARTGAMLAASTLATVAAALPAGCSALAAAPASSASSPARLIAVLRRRPGARPSFEVLLAGRVIFGVAFAAVWTAGTTLVADSAGHRALGIAIVVGGLAHLAGPPVAGVLADGFGRALPFALMAAVRRVVTAASRSCPGPTCATTGGAELRAAARAALPASRPAQRHAADRPGRHAHRGGRPRRPARARPRGAVADGDRRRVRARLLLWVASSLAAVRAGTRAVSAGVAASARC